MRKRQAELATRVGTGMAAQQAGSASEVKAEGGWVAEPQPGSSIKAEMKQEVQLLRCLLSQNAPVVEA